MTAVRDTIAAIATAPGRAGVGIVRVSGVAVPAIAAAVLGQAPKPHRATFCRFQDAHGDLIDEGIALLFPAPKSFTGEDVLELQGHGSPIVLDLLLAAAIQAGARLARPGEFTERAFLNGKLDLVQAEAIADLIDSASTAAVTAAQRSLQGEFSRLIVTLAQRIVELRTYVEAAMDFPEDEIDFLSDGRIAAELDALQRDLKAIFASARQGVLLREGLTIVIAGRPNAGKSSLLNRLADAELAIVTDTPGTTRDVIRAHIAIDGLPLHIIDTAGLRDAEDVVEKEGVKRARNAIRAADRVLLVVDDRLPYAPQITDLVSELPANLPVTVIRNKIDLSRTRPGLIEAGDSTHIAVSALTGAGIAELRSYIKRSVDYSSEEAGVFMARRRHLDALQRTGELLERGSAQLRLRAAGELLAEDLRQAHKALAEITGEFTSDDLLTKIFQSFCIGK